MDITISIEWFFFIIPFFIAFVMSFNYSDSRGSLSITNRDCYWFIAFPTSLFISLISYIIYLKFFN